MLRKTLSTLLIASTILSGCGLNAVRVETASNVSTLASTVASQANAILTDAQHRRERALLTLVASDPSCSPQFPLWIYVPDGSARPTLPTKPGPAVALCADGQYGGITPPGFRRSQLDLSPNVEDAIKPTLELIAAVSLYNQALSKVIDSPKANIGKEIDDAITLAQDAQAQATALGFKGLPDFPGLTDDQIKTAEALLQMIYDLDHERRQVKAIGVIYAKQGVLMGIVCPLVAPGKTSDCVTHEGILPRLAAQVDNWVQIVSIGSNQLDTNSLARAYERERSSLGFEGRMAFVALISDASKENDRIKSARLAFRESLVALSSLNSDLDRQLNKPSKEDRAKAAVITQQRITRALSLVLKAVAAWKGI